MAYPQKREHLSLFEGSQREAFSFLHIELLEKEKRKRILYSWRLVSM
jgi:hypothetical protein